MPEADGRRSPKKHDSEGAERKEEASKNSSQGQPFIRPEEWITKAEAARLRGVTRQAIAKLVKSGSLQTLHIAGMILVKRAEIVGYVPKSRGRPSKS